MRDIFQLFIFTLFYYQLNNILKTFIYDKFEIFQETPIIFYPVVQSANIFIFHIFIVFITNLFLFSKIRNYNVISLAFIYLKYVMDNIISYNNVGIYEYQFRRSIMWLFTTPLILKLYCDINKLTFMDINAHYHIASNIIYILTFNFRNTHYNTYIIITLSSAEIYFIYNLLSFKHQRYTIFVIYLWFLFSAITTFELTTLFNVHDIQICYLLSDMIAKITIILVVNDYDEQTAYVKNNVDLQAVYLLSKIKKTIKHFGHNNNITSKCKMVSNLIENRIDSFFPADTTTLKLELLKKILPLELEDRYLSQSKEYKQFDFICVLFTDIVSYTELAKKYDADVMYKLLNDIYTRFDDIIHRYGNLQKIETIGDAYMVVSDIYTNDQTNNVKNMVLFAFDILREIKNIPTPDGNQLQLRIGINLGKVVVGVLGLEIPRLCVIGNTVNVANRLQTSTVPNTIQVSTHVYEKVNETDFGMELQIEKKENVFLKNLGSRTTYVISPQIQPT